MQEEADKWKAWNNDWLSLLGLNKGITGLVKDFAMSYLGRAAYHDHNGPLIQAVSAVSKAFPKEGEEADIEFAEDLRDTLNDVCKAGMLLFEEDGSLHQMLKELSGLLTEKNLPYLAKGMKDNAEMAKA